MTPLSEPVFAASWAILENRFDRSFNQQATRVYFNILSTELSEEQFKAAALAAFRFEKFFPEPQLLIEYGLGGQGVQMRALRRWGEMVERMRNNESATMDPHERKLLMRATNGEPLGSIPQAQLPWVEKAWVRWYTDDVMQKARASTLELTPNVVSERRMEYAHD